MKILVTGGAGYIGTTLVPLLLEKGHHVTVFDNLMYTGEPLLPFLRIPNFEFVKGDVRDKEALKKVIEGKDVIIHLAAIVGFPACRENPELARAVNVDGAKNVSVLTKPDQFVIYASTGSNYGALLDKVCTEETPLNPLSVYGKTKTEAERILMESNKCIGFRFATAFGISPRLRLDLLINEFTYEAVKRKYLVVYESNFMRTFIHVQDIARAINFAVENREKMSGQIYNVGGDDLNYSKKQICEILVKETGAYVYYADIGEDADKRNYIVSYKKVRDLGFTPTISVEKGISEMVKAFGIIKAQSHHYNA
jgi:nucleoside-diphosphate-sugar epimerase